MSRVRALAKRRTVTPRTRSAPSGVLVLPGDVVLRAGRQHLDLVLRREPLGDQPAVVLGSAEDLGAVALDDECNLQRDILITQSVDMTSRSRASMRSGAKSARRRRCPSSTRARTGRSYTSVPSISAANSRSFGANSTPGAAERLRHRAGGVGQHRHVGRHRLDQRHAEALVLAQRDVDVGPPVERRQILVRHRPGEPEAVRQHLVLGDERPDLRVVARHAVVAADEDEAVVAVDVALVELGQPDVILDPLVGHDAADEEDVDQAVAEDLLERRPARRVGDAARCRRRSACTPVGANPSASSSCRLNSESPSARSTRPTSVAQLLPPERREPEECRRRTARRSAPA